MKSILPVFRLCIWIFSLFFFLKSNGQNVGISTNSAFTPDASAALDVSYSNKGMLIPRVALTATNAAGPITSPATSLLVYNTTAAGTSPNNVVPGFYYWNGTAWIMLSTSTQTAGLWSTIGNAGTSYPTNYLGTTDNSGLHFKTAATHRLWIDSLGSVAVGTSPVFSAAPSREKFLVDAGTTTSFNVISGRGNINNYLQLNIQNNNAGTAASSDVVATADNGTESANYVDLGINSSANTANFFGNANDAYLYNVGGTASGGNFYIGTSTTGKSLGFLTGGSMVGSGTTTNNERLRIDGSTGNVGINTITPSQKLDVNGTIVASSTTYPNYAYNSANRMAFGETNVPPNEAGSVVQYGSGSSSRNMLFAFTKTGINTSFFGNDGNQTMIGSEGTNNPITFRTGLVYSDANVMTTGSEGMRIAATGNVGIGVTNPTAVLNLKAGTATAGTAPIKLTAGTNLTTPENGAVEFDGNNYYGSANTVRYTLAKTLTTTAVLDFPSTGINSSSSLNVTLTGAADGDVIALGVPNAAANATSGNNSAYYAYVTAANTVTIRFINNNALTGAAVDPPSATFRISIIKY